MPLKQTEFLLVHSRQDCGVGGLDTEEESGEGRKYEQA